ncbi:hypothetical protein BS78_07G136800 [Paspalum vaginatum]|nr:hypothetical protein BS78_07G136800 [Paspalum vaginatum]
MTTSAVLPIKQLDGRGGYLRWKETLLLRVHTLGVAGVLFEDRPAAAGCDEAASKKWAHDDAVCRGHILATLSDRLLPDYARFATAADQWRALARTYGDDGLGVFRRDWQGKFYGFEFEQGTGDILLEQIAHAEALGAAEELSDATVAAVLCRKLPDMVSGGIFHVIEPYVEVSMSLVWEVARHIVATGIGPGLLWQTKASRNRRGRF